MFKHIHYIPHYIYKLLRLKLNLITDKIILTQYLDRADFPCDNFLRITSKNSGKA